MAPSARCDLRQYRDEQSIVDTSVVRLVGDSFRGSEASSPPRRGGSDAAIDWPRATRRVLASRRSKISCSRQGWPWPGRPYFSALANPADGRGAAAARCGCAGLVRAAATVSGPLRADRGAHPGAFLHGRRRQDPARRAVPSLVWCGEQHPGQRNSFAGIRLALRSAMVGPRATPARFVDAFDTVRSGLCSVPATAEPTSTPLSHPMVHPTTNPTPIPTTNDHRSSREPRLSCRLLSIHRVHHDRSPLRMLASW